MAVSRLPKSSWCLCLLLRCCFSPPGERQTLSQVGMGHSQDCMESSETAHEDVVNATGTVSYGHVLPELFQQHTCKLK